MWWMENRKKMSKKKKNTRNRARDTIGDYYRSNRQVAAENAENLKKEKKKKGWSRTELFMLTAIFLCLIGIFLKYVVF